MWGLVRAYWRIPVIALLGGLIAFGAVGLFAGPVVLAVGHTLLCAWMAEAGPSAEEHTASMDRV